MVSRAAMWGALSRILTLAGLARQAAPGAARKAAASLDAIGLEGYD